MLPGRMLHQDRGVHADLLALLVRNTVFHVLDAADKLV